MPPLPSRKDTEMAFWVAEEGECVGPFLKCPVDNLLCKMPLPKSGAIGWRDVLGPVAVLLLFPSKPCPLSQFCLDSTAGQISAQSS